MNDKRKEYLKKWREDNKEHIRKYKKEYAKTHDSSFKKLQDKYKQLQQENKQLKENNMSMQEEMARTWKKLDDLQQIEQEHQKINGELREESKKYKEVIDKAINNSQYWIDYYTRLNSDERIALRLQENIDILKEVE